MEPMAIGDRFGEVLAGAQRGEHPAFEQIYRDLAPLVLAYLRANGARDPDDLTSEVFLAVVRNVCAFEGDEGAFRSWVLTIAHRRLIDEFRYRARRPEEPQMPDEVTAQIAPTDATAETEALELMDGSGVGAALDALTDDQRAVITLRVLADLPIREVAMVLDKPETAIKSLQHRALATLARTLKAQDEEFATRQYPGGDRKR
jgi:RNA polymerase sigma factor (sigma-70 family)